MRKRFVIALLVLLAALASLFAGASPAGARQLPDKIIGCDSLLEWPCPGPVLW